MPVLLSVGDVLSDATLHGLDAGDLVVVAVVDHASAVAHDGIEGRRGIKQEVGAKSLNPANFFGLHDVVVSRRPQRIPADSDRVPALTHDPVAKHDLMGRPDENASSGAQ